MLKRLLAICLVYLGIISVSFAGTGYVVASVSYLKVYVSNLSDTYEGLQPKFAFGYGDWCIGSVFFAGEIFAMPFKPATFHTTTTTTIGASLKPSSTYGISLLAGINLDGAVRLFGRLSWLYSNFENFGSLNGGQGGIGLEAKFYGNWSARAELIRTEYTSGIHGGIKPKVDEGNIGVIYRFW